MLKGRVKDTMNTANRLCVQGLCAWFSWMEEIVVEVLDHRSTINFKTYQKSYKNHQRHMNDPSEWLVFENTHDPIIDQETFDIVQRLRQTKKKLTPLGEPNLLSGVLYCPDCGRKLYQSRARSRSRDKDYFVCASYRKVRDGCKSHCIQNRVIEQILLDGIQAITAFARENEDEFVELVSSRSRAAVEKSIREAKHEQEQAQARIHKLDGVIQRLYEDNVEGKSKKK